MFTPKCLIHGKEIPDVKEDFRRAKHIEQYRVGRKALYMPEGLRWNYIPISEIQTLEESFRVLPGGHCNPIRAKKPELDLTAEGKLIALPLDRPESIGKMIEVLREDNNEYLPE